MKANSRKRDDSNRDESDSDDQSPSEKKPKKQTNMAKFKDFFKLSKKEENERKQISTSAKKLPKNFANQVLDLELLIDSGNFDITVVDKLMQLYSVSI
jgi:hypothetical protein